MMYIIVGQSAPLLRLVVAVEERFTDAIRGWIRRVRMSGKTTVS